jgi:hypothetical protein
MNFILELEKRARAEVRQPSGKYGRNTSSHKQLAQLLGVSPMLAMDRFRLAQDQGMAP